MAENLRLRVVLDMAERVLAPLKSIQKGSSDAAKALKATRDRLAELNAQQAAVANVQKQQAEFARLNNQLKIKQSLLDSLRNSGAANATQIKREESAVRKLSEALEVQRAAAGKARAALNAMGITGNLSAAQARLKTDIDSTTGAMARQRAELQRLADHQKKLAALNEKHGKAMLHTGMAAGTGMAMQAAGQRGVEIGMGPVRNYSQHEDAMLGIARQVPGARNEMGQLTEVYRQAERDVRELSGQIPLATTQIADMMTASARMEVPTEKLKEFTLMASEMATAFDAVPDVITERMGIVAKTFDIPLTNIRGLADAINYLDDNAISKGADIIDYMTRVSGVAALAKMDPKEYAALGSTLLTLGERTETAGTATNSIVQTLAAATKGTKGFRSAMAELGLSTEAIEKGMTKDALGTINEVMEAIRAMPEEKRLGIMVELVGKEHSDTLAKLVANPKELARQRELAMGNSAQGSMAREAAARNAALSAQWQMMKNRAFNLGATVGETVAPALLQLMKTVNPLIDGFSRWVQANPVLVGWVMKLAIGAAALMAVLGAVLIPLALVVGKFLLLRFVFARLSLALLGMRTAAATAGPAMGLLYRLGVMLGRAFAFARGAAVLLVGGIKALAVFLMANPVVAAIVVGIAAAALLIYKYWQPIAAFFGGIWTGFSDALAPAFAALGNALGPLRPVLDWLLGVLGGVWSWFTALLAPIQATEQQLQGAANMGQFLGQVLGTLVMGFLSIPQAFFQLGVDVITGFVNGLTSSLGWLKDQVLSMASSVASWFAEKLGIASPSRVFMEYGGWISQGAAIGMQNGQGAVRTAALALATAAAVPMQAAAAVPPVPPAVQAQASAAAQAAAVPPVAAMPPTAKAAQAMAAAPAQAMQATAGVATQEPRPPLRIDNRPPLMASGGAAPAASTTHINLTINAAPGMDERALARAVERAVAAELTRRDRAQRSRVLSSMSDID